MGRQINVCPNLLTNTATTRLRRELLELIFELEATLCLSVAFTSDLKGHIERARAAVASSTKRELREGIAEMSGRIAELRADHRVKATPQQIVELYRFVSGTPDGHNTWVPVHVLRAMFVDYGAVLKGSDRFPPHARVAIDPSGTLYNETRHPEIFLLEASLFEDLAALFNLASGYPFTGFPAQPKKDIKAQNALLRATVLAALHFVEAFVNGEATEYLMTTSTTLDERTRDTLMDWDSARGRPRYLSLSEKVLQYQRIILNVEHAPLQTSNCHELLTLLDIAKRTRDALAHPSAVLRPDTMTPEKEMAILSLTPDEVARVVDAAIIFVRRFGGALHSDRTYWWLHERGADGRFAPSAFD